MSPKADEEAIENWLRAVEQPLVEVEHATYRLSDFVGWQRDRTLQLRPHYQRGSVWNERDKSFLIDSVVRGYPLPLIVLQDEIHESGPTVRKRVVDGQQRLRTLFSFIDHTLLDDEVATELDMGSSNSFTYTPPDLDVSEGFTFEQLPEPTQRRIMSARLPTVLLTTSAIDSNVLEVYDRLNSTGLDLNAQELRYARRDGEFADFCYRFTRSNQARWVDWKLFRPRDVARMLDVQFASELVLLALNGVDKTGKKEIDGAYADEALRKGVPDAQRVGESLQVAMDLLDDVLSDPTSPDPFRMFRSKGWFYSLFALTLQELGLLTAELTPPTEPPKKLDTDGAASELARVTSSGPARLEEARRSDPDLVRAISGGASDKAARIRRVRFLAGRS